MTSILYKGPYSADAEYSVHVADYFWDKVVKVLMGNDKIVRKLGFTPFPFSVYTQHGQVMKSLIIDF